MTLAGEWRHAVSSINPTTRNVRFPPIADIGPAAKLTVVKELHPVVMSKWLGLAYAGGIILFLLWGADAPDVVLLSFLFLPWMVGPAALAALGAKQSASEGGAWAFFMLEAGIIGSTIWLWFDLVVIAPDAQNGIAMMFFPVRQYAAVLIFFVLAVVLGWRSRPAEAGQGSRR